MVKALVLLAEGFEEIEAMAPIDILRRAGIETITAGVTGNMVTSSKGVMVRADQRLIDMNPDAFDVIVLPGGSPGYKTLMNSQTVLDMVENMAKKGKIIAAICGAPLTLTKLNLLNGVRATISPGMEKELDMPRDSPVVMDKNYITSQGPGTAVEFGLAIVSKLLGKQKADIVRQQIVA